MKQYFLSFALIFFFATASLAQIKHDKWNTLLKKHVDTHGNVDYKGFINSTSDFQAYLDDLSANPPQESWSKNEKLAYWINAYNAFTVKLIIDNYPLESIQDLHPMFKIPGLNTVWHKEFFKIGGEEESLNDIEHKILRKQFNEPRIHFAINCASVSCPNLRNEAFFAHKMEAQLTEQAKKFINDTSKNKLSANQLELSKIFSWFKGDFTKKTSLIAFLNQYADIKIAKDADIDYLDYNWQLNEKK